MVVEYNLTIKKAGETPAAILQMEGYQTDETIYCDVTYTNQSISFLFKSYDDGRVKNRYGVAQYKPGGLLFTLGRTNINSFTGLSTQWKELNPQDQSKSGFKRISVQRQVISKPASPAGAPCWDDVPPARKFAQHHVISGSATQLSADGIHIDTKRTETEKGILIELTVTNCSANAVQVLPNTYDLVVLGPGGPKNDKMLSRLDPTQFQHLKNRPYPALRPETLEYGRIGVYFLFFAPDIYYPQMDHNEQLKVVIGQWQFELYFPKKRVS